LQSDKISDIRHAYDVTIQKSNFRLPFDFPFSGSNKFTFVSALIKSVNRRTIGGPYKEPYI
jgi:hypothetical protein